MYDSFFAVAKKVGCSISTLNKYRAIGLFDDLVRINQHGKVKNIAIDEGITNRLSEIYDLKDKGLELQEIYHRLIPVSIYKIDIENLSGKHHTPQRLKIYFHLSDELEKKYFLDEPSDWTEQEKNEIFKILTDEKRYDLANKLNFNPKPYTFNAEEFEKEIFTAEYIQQLIMLRELLTENKPKSFATEDNNELTLHELYITEKDYEQYNSCFQRERIIKFKKFNKYAIVYSIAREYLGTILFNPVYEYLMHRIKKFYRAQVRDYIKNQLKQKKHQNAENAILISNDEIRLLNLFKNNNVLKLEIIPLQGDRIQIKKKEILKGDFKLFDLLNIITSHDYQTIKLQIQNGKVISVQQEKSEIKSSKEAAK